MFGNNNYKYIFTAISFSEYEHISKNSYLYFLQKISIFYNTAISKITYAYIEWISFDTDSDDTD